MGMSKIYLQKELRHIRVMLWWNERRREIRITTASPVAPTDKRWCYLLTSEISASYAMAGKAGGHCLILGEKLVIHKYAKCEGCMKAFLSFSLFPSVPTQWGSQRSQEEDLQLISLCSSHISDLFETAHESQHVLQAQSLGPKSLPPSFELGSPSVSHRRTQ